MMPFDVPVALFMFKRDKAVEIVRRIAAVQPRKLYLLADYGRNEDECRQAEAVRHAVEAEITWECDVIKNYATENRGVYENIGEGAKWVLAREKWAIFLEDDNLPEPTFFPFCREMLTRYEDDARVLWICGTNYLGNYHPKSGDSYVFTRHMLPCGWASWSNKFLRFYDGKMELYEDAAIQKRVAKNYCDPRLYRQYKGSWSGEYFRIKAGGRPISWDYQMDFSIKAHSLFGICPCQNQIKNIGVDGDSIHGGNSFSDEMTRRFCGMTSHPIPFPLQHPQSLQIDPIFEKKIGKIMLYPWRQRVRSGAIRLARFLLRVPQGESTKAFLFKKKG